MLLLRGDRFKLYYTDWLIKVCPEAFRTPKVGSYHKVQCEVKRIYLDPIGDFAYVCERCDCKDTQGEFVLKQSEMQ